MIQFHTAQCTSAGGRPANQDAVDVRRAHGYTCGLIADGLGGHRGGEWASRTVVETLGDAFSAHPTLATGGLGDLFDHAQAALRTRHRGDAPTLSSMRTTLVVFATDGAVARWAHVGDSRLYAFRNGAIAAQTQDHSVPQALVAAGEISPREARSHTDRNRVLRSLGADDPVRPTVAPNRYRLQPGDAFLLCTDGFWESVTDLEMTVDLAKAAAPADWLRWMEDRLLLRADGDFDNYSALALFAV